MQSLSDQQTRAVRSRTPQALDALILAALLVALLGVSAISLATSPIWRPGAPPDPPFCPPGQVPGFSFGFYELSQQLGGIIGQPTECEHGVGGTGDTVQRTTTGEAVYRWCTNTPTFTRGQEHWMLVPGGVEYWTGEDTPPQLPPVVRMPDLRHPCPA